MVFRQGSLAEHSMHAAKTRNMTGPVRVAKYPREGCAQAHIRHSAWQQR